MKRFFNNLEETYCRILLIITVTSVVLNVFCRAAGFGTISTSEEIAIDFLLYGLFILEQLLVTKRKMHIGVDMLVQMFSDKGKRFSQYF